MDRKQIENCQELDRKLLGTRQNLGGNQIENGQAWIEN